MVSYCMNCGEKVKEGVQFCVSCGTPLEDSKQPSSQLISEASNGNQHDVQNETVAPVNPMEDPQQPSSQLMSEASSKDQSNVQGETVTRGPKAKGKFLNFKTIFALIIIVLLAGTYFFIGRMFTPETVSEGFIDAITKKDVQKVKDYINEGQIEIKATDKETEEFIKYLNSHPKILSELASDLKKESIKLDKSGKLTADNSEDSDIANIKLDGKKWAIFDRYVIEVKPYYASVESTYDDTEIQINGKKVITLKENDEETVGPFLPGEQQIKAVIKNEFGQVEKTEEIDLSDMEDRTQDIEFYWDDMYLSLYTDYYDATLFINGKSTGKTLEEFNNQLGPLPLDGSVKLHAERKFGSETKKTDTVVVNKETSEIDLSFDYEEDYEYESSSLFESDDSNEKSVIIDTIYDHYANISDDEFEDAYDLFSSERKGSMTEGQWSKGLQENISDVVETVDVIDIDDNTATAYVEMTSKDDNNDGTYLIQEWSGNWYLVKEDGRWVLDKAKLQKDGSRTE